MAVTKALIPVNHQTRLKEAWHKRSYSINCHLEWRTCMCLISGIVYVIQSVKRYSLKLAFIFFQIRNGCSYWNNLPLTVELAPLLASNNFVYFAESQVAACSRLLYR